MAGFEPATSSPPDWCANQAAPHPETWRADGGTRTRDLFLTTEVLCQTELRRPGGLIEVRPVGVEPTRPGGHQLLRLARLPFRHGRVLAHPLRARLPSLDGASHIAGDGAGGVRTRDLLGAIQVLSRLSYGPVVLAAATPGL